MMGLGALIVIINIGDMKTRDGHARVLLFSQLHQVHQGRPRSEASFGLACYYLKPQIARK